MNPFIRPQPVAFETPPEPKFDVLAGSKSYIAAIGLIGLAIYQLTQKDYVAGIQSIMAAIAAFGIRNAVGRQENQVFQMKQQYMLLHQQLKLNEKNNTGGL
jgi:hypothetical protein